MEIIVRDVPSVNHLKIANNELYYGQFYEGKVSKISLIESNPIPVEVISGLGQVTGIEFYDNDLYIALYGADKIVKLEDIISDVDYATLSPNVTVYPNPVGETLFVSNLPYQASEIKLFNNQGMVVQITTAVGECQMNVDHLQAGMYFLSINDENLKHKVVIK